jgi:predicted Zn-dependent protease
LDAEKPVSFQTISPFEAQNPCEYSAPPDANMQGIGARLAALEYPMDSPRAVNQQCQALIALSRFEEAEDLFLRLRESHPHLPFGYDGIAQIRHRQRRFEAALEAWKVVSDKFPDRPHAVNQQCQALIALSKFEEAEDLFLQLRESHPHLPFGYDGAAQVKFRQELYEDALEASKGALEKFPNRPIAVLRLCLALEKLQRYTELIGEVDRHLWKSLTVQPPSITRDYFKTNPLLSVHLLQVYCQAHLHLEANDSIAVLLQELVNYQKEGRELEGLFGGCSQGIQWFGNVIIHESFEE